MQISNWKYNIQTSQVTSSALEVLVFLPIFQL